MLSDPVRESLERLLQECVIHIEAFQMRPEHLLAEQWLYDDVTGGITAHLQPPQLLQKFPPLLVRHEHF